MASPQEALDLVISIKSDIDKNRKIGGLLPKILGLSKVIEDEKLEDICLLELGGYYETGRISAEKIENYAKEVGRQRIIQLADGKKELEKIYIKESLKQIEEQIELLTNINRPSTAYKRNSLVGRRSSIETFFINKIENIHKEFKQYYPIKIIDNYLDEIMDKLEDLSDSIIDKVKSIYF